MHPASDFKVLRIEQAGANLSVERITVPKGTKLQWEGPPGTTGEIEFVDASPFGNVKKVTHGQRLEATNEGIFPYRCFLRKGHEIVAKGSPGQSSWGGEVEVTGKGGGRTP